jgi:aminoglycoside phosphotransferase (APT) family kinase protein
VILAAHERACAWLLARPTGVLHGELFASNVLVDARDGVTLRIWPIDWETAARGPVLLDLATLTAGRWSPRDRGAIVAGYRRSAGAWPGGDEAFEMDLEACRLQMCVEQLGASATWSPPREHQHDWLAEAQLITDQATW